MSNNANNILIMSNNANNMLIISILDGEKNIFRLNIEIYFLMTYTIWHIKNIFV
jgi:hypothetical protein